LPVDNILQLSCHSSIRIDEISRFSLPSLVKESRSLRKYLLQRQADPLGTSALQYLHPSFASRYSLLAVIVGHFAPCFCITFDKTEQRIISGSDDGSVKIWCSHTGILIYSLLGHESAVSDVSCSPDNQILASCSLDGTARFWDMRTGRHICHTTVDGNSSLQSIQFHPKNYTLCIAASNGFIYLLKYRITVNRSGEVTGMKLYTDSMVKFMCKITAKQEIRCCTFSQGGNRIIVGSTDGLIRMFLSEEKTSLLSNKEVSISPPSLLILDAHEGHVTSVHCSYRGSRFVTGSWDGTARIWSFDQETAEWCSLCLPIYQDGPKFQANPEKRNRVLLVLWSFDDSKIITSSDDCIIRIWDSYTGKLIHRLVFHDKEPYILAPHPKIDSLVLSAGWDGKVALWNIETGRIEASFSSEGRKFNDGQFNSDGTSFALVDSLGSILIYAMGEEADAYSLAPCEQFFPVDFHRATFDAEGMPLDSVTMLPLHENTRIGSLDINAVPNSSKVPVDYGTGFGVETSELELFLERCDLETASWEEMQIISREKEHYSQEKLHSVALIEQILKRKKKPKFGDEVEDFEEGIEQQELSNSLSNASTPERTQSQLIRQFVDAYDSSLDESYQEFDAESSFSENSLDSEAEEASDSDTYSNSRSHSYASSNRRRPRRPQRGQQRTQPREIEEISTSQPSEWVFSKQQSLIPYIPQIGDEIAYFRQGHEAFLNLVPQRHALRNLFFSQLPWLLDTNLEPVVFGIVEEISFLLPNVDDSTVISLKIAVESGRGIRKRVTHLKVTYFDHEDMVDFIILASRFHASNNKMNLRPNTQVNVLFSGGELYRAQIVEKSPLDAELPYSCWQMYKVAWQDQSTEDDSRLSPWELLKMNESLSTMEQHHPTWTPTQQLPIDLQNLAEQHPNFALDVDFSLYPEYLLHIAYPICITTVLERLKNGYYRTWEHFRFECQLICKNAMKFNQPASEIFREAKELGKQFEEIFLAIEHPQQEQQEECEDEESQESDSFTPRITNRSSSRRAKRQRRLRIEDNDSEDEIYS
jgi:WD40 repeat protein